MASTRHIWLKLECVAEREKMREVSPVLCQSYHQSDVLGMYTNLILILSRNEGVLYIHVFGSSVEHGLASIEYFCMYILTCVHSQAIDYFNINYFSVAGYW